MPIRLVAGRVHLLELFDGALPLCLYIDTDAAIEITLRKVDVQVGDLGFGDLGLHLPRLLVGRDPHIGGLVAHQLMENRMENLAQMIGYPVRSICFPKMHIIDGSPRFRRVLILGILRTGLGDQDVEELIIALVLQLINTSVSGAWRRSELT